ncbi:hypothetical protein OK074_3806 [Actinobacteria bacterium OK074]|nr:hypothetical protein OK074_3806 [Actinobacteria bacterium OK074]
MRPMSYGQGEPPWDPWKPGSQQPRWGSETNDTPDWAALAHQSETRNKRRRLLFVVGGAFATVAIGAAVAMAVVSANKSDDTANQPASLPSTAAIPSGSAAAPSFAPTSAPPPLDPTEFISSASKDTAPLSADTLFPTTRVTLNSNVYTKAATASTTKCALAAQGTLPAILTKNDCTRVIRVTYRAANGVAVTVGAAVFSTTAEADRTKTEADKQSIITSLPGNGVATFCRSAFCRSTTNSYGRYAYFTIGGFTNGTDVTTKDTRVFTAGDDLAQYVFSQIRQRGVTQAQAAANQ